MDAKINPLDETTNVDLMDVMRRGDFSDAVTLFGRLIRLAYSQGQIDAFTSVMQRVPVDELETNIRNLRIDQ